MEHLVGKDIYRKLGEKLMALAAESQTTRLYMPFWKNCPPQKKPS